MTDPIQSAAQQGLQRATEGYWVRRESRQLEAGAECLQQIDSLVGTSGTPGEREAVALVKAVAGPEQPPACRLAALQEGLSYLASGAASGLGPQAGLAARIFARAAGMASGPSLALHLLQALQQLSASWGADAATVRLVSDCVACGTSDRSKRNAAQAAFELLSQAPPRTPADTAKLACGLMQKMQSETEQAAVAQVAVRHLQPALRPDLSAFLEAGTKAGFGDAAAMAVLRGFSDGIPADAPGVLQLCSQAAEDAGLLALQAATWLAQQATRTPASGDAALWQDALKRALQAPAAAREPLCQALLAQHHGEARQVAENLEDPTVREGLARLVLDQAQSPGDEARQEWARSLQAALDAAPELSQPVIACAGKAPDRPSAAASQVYSLLQPFETRGAKGLTVARALSGGLVKLAARWKDPDATAFASLFSMLCQPAYVDPNSSLSGIERMLAEVPEEDSTGSPADTRRLSNLAYMAIENMESNKDKVAASLAALQMIRDAAQSRGENQVADGVKAVQDALAGPWGDPQQQAALAGLPFAVIADMESTSDFMLGRILASLVREDGIEPTARAVLVQAIMKPAVSLLSSAGHPDEAAQYDLLGHLADLRLESSSDRVSLLQAGLDAVDGRELAAGPAGLAGIGLSAAEQVSAEHEVRDVLAGSCEFIQQFAASHGHPRQGAAMACLHQVLDACDSVDVTRNALALVQERGLGEGPGWVSSIALQLLDQASDSRALWNAVADALDKQAAAEGDTQFVPVLVAQGRDALKRADPMDVPGAVAHALQRLAELKDEDLLRAVEAANRAQAGSAPSIHKDQEDVSIGGVKVKRQHPSP